MAITNKRKQSVDDVERTKGPGEESPTEVRAIRYFSPRSREYYGLTIFSDWRLIYQSNECLFDDRVCGFRWLIVW